MLNKIFATAYAGAGRYSPPKCIGAIKTPIMENPDPQHINTSVAERENYAPLHPIDQRLLKEI